LVSGAAVFQASRSPLFLKGKVEAMGTIYGCADFSTRRAILKKGCPDRCIDEIKALAEAKNALG
jgi:hypothetical protein